MRNEYRIRAIKGHPGYLFVEVRYWWFPFIWEVISAHGDWMKEDEQMRAAKNSALTHAQLGNGSSKSKTVEYLGRLP